MAQTRKSLVAAGAGRIKLGEETIPVPKPSHVLVLVTANMISPGTKLAGIGVRRAEPLDGAPRSFGYSNAGVIHALGDNVTNRCVVQRVACMGGGYVQHATYDFDMNVQPITLDSAPESAGLGRCRSTAVL